MESTKVNILNLTNVTVTNTEMSADDYLFTVEPTRKPTIRTGD
jgi:hypothetical protein